MPVAHLRPADQASPRMHNIHNHRVADLPPAILLTARGYQAVSAFEPEVILE